METLKKNHPKIFFEAWDDIHLKNVLEIILPLGYQVKKLGKENYIAEVKK